MTTDATGATAPTADTTAATAAAADPSLLAAAKPEGDKPAADTAAKPEAAKEGDKPADGKDAPTTYDLKMPEGFTAEPETLAELTAFAGEAKLSGEQAQKVADMGVKLVQKVAAEQQKYWKDTNDGWRKEITDDAEFGGAKLPDTITMAGRAIDKFGSDKLRDALNITGAGNHPEIVRFFARVGKAISEDKVVLPGGAATEKSAADLFYPSGKKE